MIRDTHYACMKKQKADSELSAFYLKHRAPGKV